MQIKLTNLFVNNQDHALHFYTGVLGFVVKHNIPMGEFKWLTVVAAEGSPDIELLLEPNQNPAAQTYQQALFNQGIPAAAFYSPDIVQEFARLKEAGVRFTTAPTQAGPAQIVVFDDTCGNLIQLYQV